ncbi:PAS domain-containing protein [Clostridium sp. DL1XJH146]
MKNNKNIMIENNEIFYKSLFKNNQEIMILLNSETFRIVDCNLSTCNFYGYSYEEMFKFDIFNNKTI